MNSVADGVSTSENTIQSYIYMATEILQATYTLVGHNPQEKLRVSFLTIYLDFCSSLTKLSVL